MQCRTVRRSGFLPTSCSQQRSAALSAQVGEVGGARERREGGEGLCTAATARQAANTDSAAQPAVVLRSAERSESELQLCGCLQPLRLLARSSDSRVTLNCLRAFVQVQVSRFQDPLSGSLPAAVPLPLPLSWTLLFLSARHLTLIWLSAAMDPMRLFKQKESVKQKEREESGAGRGDGALAVDASGG